MHQIVRSLAAAAALSLLVPSAAFAQPVNPREKKAAEEAAKAAAAKAKAAPAAATAKKPVKATNETRWTSMLASAATLAQEGVEIKRIDAKEKAAIDAFMNKIRTQIASAKADGVTEAEEDAIDQLISDVVMGIANRYQDKAPAKAADKAPAKAAVKK